MDTLAFMVACIEQGRTTIAPAFASAHQRRHLDRLLTMNAVTRVRGTAAICPRCEAHGVRVISVDRAMCIDCGEVALAEHDMQRLAPDGAWLRRRLAQALGLMPGSSWPVLPGRVWRLGDVGSVRARRRILYGERIGCSDIQRALHAAWPAQVGHASTILVTTTVPDRIFLPGLAVAIVPLASVFQIRGNGLVAVGSMWDGIVENAPLIEDVQTFGPFTQDYRGVLLPGEAVPIPLTPAQSALLRVLWEQNGVPIQRDILIARAGLDMEKPVEAFPRPKYPEANRAYRTLVRSDRRGRYWLPRIE